MKRRAFMTRTAIGGAAICSGGCSIGGVKHKVIRPKLHEFDTSMLDITVPKPKSGSMPTGEIGTTGIRVSKFTFGSHIPPGLIPPSASGGR